jgi:hypothetical protein
MLMTYEQIKGLNIKKGDRIRYQDAAGRQHEGEVIKKRTKTKSGGKSYNAQKGAWIDAGMIKKIELVIQPDNFNFTMAEDTFQHIERM